MSTPPVLGLIVKQVAPVESGAPFGRLTPYYRQLLERATLQGWRGYVFSPRDVLRQRSTIWGWSRQVVGWKREFMPIPHVAYTRIAHLTSGEIEILLWLRAEGNVQFVNQPEVDQITQDYWRLLQILQSHPSLTPHIPDTTLARDLEALGTALTTQTSIHVRGRFNDHAAGQAYIHQQGDQYLVGHELKGTQHTRTFHSLHDLYQYIQRAFDELIVQAYTEPLRFEQCPLHIRAFWQRQRNGQWQETCSMLRLGSPDSQTYQAVTAGLLHKYSHTLKGMIGNRLKALQYQVKNSSRTIVELLSQRGHGAGELAVDFMIGASYQLWITGVSTGAGLESLRQLATPEPATRAMGLTLGYAASLQELATTNVPMPAPLETA